MTDVLEIAIRRRDRIKAELAKLDAFVRYAEELSGAPAAAETPKPAAAVDQAPAAKAAEASTAPEKKPETAAVTTLKPAEAGQPERKTWSVNMFADETAARAHG